jgi:hypothetical protein
LDSGVPAFDTTKALPGGFASWLFSGTSIFFAVSETEARAPDGSEVIGLDLKKFEEAVSLNPVTAVIARIPRPRSPSRCFTSDRSS